VEIKTKAKVNYKIKRRKGENFTADELLSKPGNHPEKKKRKREIIKQKNAFFIESHFLEVTETITKWAFRRKSINYF
jgi:hypothetical protein